MDMNAIGSHSRQMPIFFYESARNGSHQPRTTDGSTYREHDHLAQGKILGVMATPCTGVGHGVGGDVWRAFNQIEPKQGRGGVGGE